MPTAPTAHGYRPSARATPLRLAHLRRGIAASDPAVRRALHRLVLSRRQPHWRQAEGAPAGARDRDRTVVLFTDATILTETPPLRAWRSPTGEMEGVAVGPAVNAVASDGPECVAVVVGWPLPELLVA